MEKLRNYDISFSSLKLGNHSFKMAVGQSFFDLFEFDQEFKNPDIEVDIELVKHSSFMELKLQTKGIITLTCDISDEEYEQEIKNAIKVLVKFGEEYDDTNEAVLIIPVGSHSVNVAQLIYESVVLSIPMKHVHPRYVEGYRDKYTDLLEKYSLSEEEREEENNE
ncbi:MAG: DUF177 domain-containing protein [Flavobacteriaceae bacterium]|jgi:uncharacterized metal-binding protein YceD (DUF177 family)|nr:DUF177 domain-containing protein [Flavobacteriaceae bacterium]